MELNYISAFSASYSKINPCFADRKRIGVWNCHANCEHLETTIFASVFYEKTEVALHSKDVEKIYRKGKIKGDFRVLGVFLLLILLGAFCF
jgi:hypothetical protein